MRINVHDFVEGRKDDGNNSQKGWGCSRRVEDLMNNVLQVTLKNNVLNDSQVSYQSWIR